MPARSAALFVQWIGAAFGAPPLAGIAPVHHAVVNLFCVECAVENVLLQRFLGVAIAVAQGPQVAQFMSAAKTVHAEHGMVFLCVLCACGAL